MALYSSAEATRIRNSAGAATVRERPTYKGRKLPPLSPSGEVPKGSRSADGRLLGRPWRAPPVWTGVAAVGIALAIAPGCCRVSGDLEDRLDVRGKLVGQDTAENVAGVAVGGQLFGNGELPHEVWALYGGGTPQFPLSAEDGTFTITFTEFIFGCDVPFTISLRPLQGAYIPPPDQVEIVVARESLPVELDIDPELRSGDDLRIVCPCEQRFLFDVNEENFVDPTAPGDVLEFKEPILVPPTCEACCTLLVVRGRLSGLDEKPPRFSVRSDAGDSSGLQRLSARRSSVTPDGTFEAWFSQVGDGCPPGGSFARPQWLHVSQDREGCAVGADVELDPGNTTVTQIGEPESFPRMVVDLHDVVVLPPCAQ